MTSSLHAKYIRKTRCLLIFERKRDPDGHQKDRMNATENNDMLEDSMEALGRRRKIIHDNDTCFTKKSDAN